MGNFFFGNVQVITWTPSRIIHLLFLAGALILFGFGTLSWAQPIAISSPEELQKIGHDAAWPLGGDYVQTADIDLSAFANFNPIGDFQSETDNAPFTGSFDGNNFTISNLNFTWSYVDGVGLFACTSTDATLSNINMVDCQLSGDWYLGALVGWNKGIINNCSVTTSAINGTDQIGLLVGVNEGTINTSNTSGTVSGFSTIGGLVGMNKGQITSCQSDGSVSGLFDHIGGLAGNSFGGEITNCTSQAQTKGRNVVGGLAGLAIYGSTIADCHSTGTVSGDTSIGGLVGYLHEGSSIYTSYSQCEITGSTHTGGLVGLSEKMGTISECFATGSVAGLYYTGGLVGKNSQGAVIQNCYATGFVVGKEFVGGLTGRIDFRRGHQNNYSTGAVLGEEFTGGFSGNLGVYTTDFQACFWDIEATNHQSNHTSIEGVIGKTTVQMTQFSTFSQAQWNITDDEASAHDHTWVIMDGLTYPILSWQIPDTEAIPNNLHITPTINGEGLIERSPSTLYTLNQPVILEAVPEFNHLFSHWTGPGIADENNDYHINSEQTIAVTKNKSVTATFLKYTAISTAGELQSIGHSPDYPLSGNYIQTAHINLAQIDNFSPIGQYVSYTDKTPFSGSYNGNHYNIENLTINAPSSEAVGLFSNTELNTTLKNIHLVNCTITADRFVGGLVGLDHVTAIENCSVAGSIKGNGRNVGGLTGFCNNSKINNCQTNCTVTSQGEEVGGLAGELRLGTISNSSSNGTVKGGLYTGGLVGMQVNGTISACSSSGTIEGQTYTGGIAGSVTNGIIKSCYSTCNVNGNNDVGGLTGMSNTDTIIENCYSLGTTTGVEYVGGITGVHSGGQSYPCIIKNCYAAGRITATSPVGGLTGASIGLVENSFWNINTTGQNTSADNTGVGLTTGKLTGFSTFDNAQWDISNSSDFTSDNNWTIVDGVSYPILTWQVAGRVIPSDLSLRTSIKGFGRIDTTPPAPFTLNQPIQLTATPAENCTFSHWTEPDITEENALEETTNPLPITVTDPATKIQATFTGAPPDSAGFIFR